jgi:hypothetical protein
VNVFEAERITCGASSPDERTEARFRALRAAEGFSLGGGCGMELPWPFAYRCVECGRFMHLTCIREHFETSRDGVAGGVAR